MGVPIQLDLSLDQRVVPTIDLFSLAFPLRIMPVNLHNTDSSFAHFVNESGLDLVIYALSYDTNDVANTIEAIRLYSPDADDNVQLFTFTASRYYDTGMLVVPIVVPPGWELIFTPGTMANTADGLLRLLCTQRLSTQ